MTKQGKLNKQLKNKYGKLADSMVAYYEHLDLRRIEDLDDVGLAYLMASVKGVNMLDLDETEITNESIRLLTSLEYLKELRVKGCRIDNSCIPDLNKIPGLEFLHLKNTAVNIDGLLQLNALTNLRTILFSAEDVVAINEKMLQLKVMHPACEFIIDGKPYYFDNIERLMYAVKGKPLSYKLKIKNEPPVVEWSKWIIKPSETYYETEKQGPYPLNNIEWIEINPIEERKEGKLVPLERIDQTPEIVTVIEELSIPYMIVEGVMRIYIVKTN